MRRDEGLALASVGAGVAVGVVAAPGGIHLAVTLLLAFLLLLRALAGTLVGLKAQERLDALVVAASVAFAVVVVERARDVLNL